MGGIFTVLITLGLMQPAAADDRREIDSRYVHSDPMVEAKRKLGDAMLKRRTTLLFALGGSEISKLEAENDLRSKP
jgi:hypothetical protein